MALKQKRGSKIPAAIGLGLLVSLLVTVIVAVIMAWLIAGERAGENAAGYGAAAALLLGSVSGAMVTAGKIKARRMIMCLISGAVYFLVLLCCNAMFFDGQYQGIGVSALLICGGSVAVGFMGLKQNARTKPKLRKMRIR